MTRQSLPPRNTPVLLSPANDGHPDRLSGPSQKLGTRPNLRSYLGRCLSSSGTSTKLAFAFLSTLAAPALHAQASYAGTGPGSYVSLGASFSGFESGQYGKTLLTGGSLFLDANLYRRIGVEAEARALNRGSSEGIRQTTYLVGPKLSLKGRRFRPYAKLLAGRGDFRFPFGDAYGKYFVFAPGAGIDWRVHHSRLSLRLIDVEYQVWPNFVPFGEISPFGASAGLSLQLSDPKR